jgi:hypothetical protein
MLAQSQKCALRTQAIFQPFPLGTADRAEQDGIALSGQGQRLLRERDAHFVDGLPADITG